MASPLHTQWVNTKKNMPKDADKLFKKDFGPTLDKCHEAHQACAAVLAKTMQVNGFQHPIPDLERLRSKIAQAIPLYTKAEGIANEYKTIVAKMPHTSPGVTQAATVLNQINTTLATELANMRTHIPTDADVAKFKTNYMQATLNQMHH